MINRNKYCNPTNLFIVVSLVNILIMIVMLMVSNGRALLAMGYGESLFCDFWMHIKRILNYDSIYGNMQDADAIFPPMAYVFLSFFSQIVAFKNEQAESIRDIATSGYGILVLVMYITLFVMFFAMAVNYVYSNKTKPRLFTTMS